MEGTLLWGECEKMSRIGMRILKFRHSLISLMFLVRGHPKNHIRWFSQLRMHLIDAFTRYQNIGSHIRTQYISWVKNGQIVIFEKK